MKARVEAIERALEAETACETVLHLGRGKLGDLAGLINATSWQ